MENRISKDLKEMFTTAIKNSDTIEATVKLADGTHGDITYDPEYMEVTIELFGTSKTDVSITLCDTKEEFESEFSKIVWPEVPVTVVENW